MERALQYASFQKNVHCSETRLLRCCLVPPYAILTFGDRTSGTEKLRMCPYYVCLCAHCSRHCQTLECLHDLY